MEFYDLLLKYDACRQAKEWAKGKTWQEVYNTCHRGDWLLWLFRRTNPDNLKEITLAKGLCAKTVVHLMKDERSIKAVEASIKFGNGEISREELNAAYAAAYAAYAAAYADAADAAAYADAAYADAKIKNQLETANICRQVLPIEIWNI